MPYLRIHCPDLPAPRKQEIAATLTDAVVELSASPRGGPTPAEMRERTTVHFTPYREEDFFIGGRTLA